MDPRAVLREEFVKEVFQLSDGVSVAVGFGAANSVMIQGDDGVIIVDTQYGTEAAEQVRDAFRQITQDPVVGVIYTHGHSDHTGGTSVFTEGAEVPIFAGPPSAGTLDRYGTLSEVLAQRGRRQFGSNLQPQDKVDGIAPVGHPTGGIGEGKLPPTDLVTSSSRQVTIAGVELELIPAPGESEDHLLVWMPDRGILIGGDNFYFSFPNLYALRGTPYRDVSQWIITLDAMIGLEAEILVTGHTRPIMGSDSVLEVLTDYRDAMDHVLTATLEGANQGVGPDELAATITLPERLRHKPYLQEFYGVIPWAVRSIYGGYLGWFDGNPTELFPLPPREEAERMVRLAGSPERLLARAVEAISAQDYQWACQLLDYLLALEPDSPESQLLKAEALRALAEMQLSSNARHYYLASAEELEGAGR